MQVLHMMPTKVPSPRPLSLQHSLLAVCRAVLARWSAERIASFILLSIVSNSVYASDSSTELECKFEPNNQISDKLNKNGAAAVLFLTAEWCMSCKMMERTLPTVIAKIHPKIELISINVDEDQLAARRCNVRSIPALILYSNGNKRLQLIGANTEEFMKSYFVFKLNEGSRKPVFVVR